MSPRSSVAEAAATRSRIIERAIVLASAEGLEGLTIGRLAADIGMSKAGVIGHFGTKETLQLAAFDTAVDRFREHVIAPAAGQPPGLRRLRALCDGWIDHLTGGQNLAPGGCLLFSASTEYDGRPGRVRDAVVGASRTWQAYLETTVREAVQAAELPADTDPAQVVFELTGIALAAHQAAHLHGDPHVSDRARRGIRRLLNSPGGR